MFKILSNCILKINFLFFALAIANFVQAVEPMLAAGPSHTLALKANGSLWAWGDNQYGQLGDGTRLSRDMPVQVGTEADWEAVAAGGEYLQGHSFALKADGSLWAWGGNMTGQLGDGSGRSQDRPVQVGPDTDWQTVVTGGTRAFALKTDGSLWAWGGNWVGQLGDGTGQRQNTPVQVGADTDWRVVVVMRNSTFGLKTDGSLWAWGDNQYGQLGDGTKTNQTVPIQIRTLTDWQTMAAGEIGLLAIKTDGSLWGGWSPEVVQMGFATDWQSVETGGLHMLALKTNGSLWAWGENRYGQLGDGTTIDQNVRAVFSGVQVGTTTDWQAVTAGGNHTLAFKTDGSLWGWGDNSSGQLGDGERTQSNPIQVGLATDWQSVTAAEGGWSELRNYSLALKTDGSLWAWGANGNGQLGDGTTVNRSRPVQVGSEIDWLSVMAARNSSTFALKTDGSLWAWGNNENGQLGDGTTISRSEPVQVGIEIDWQSVVTGSEHTFALKIDGSLWAWGKNSDGQLGDGTRINRNIPFQVGVKTDWQMMAAGVKHTLALKTDGSLWAWGSNSSSQLGGGEYVEILPIQVGLATDWQVVIAGEYHSLALKTDGSLWAWGANQSGEIGIGSRWETRNPSRVGSETNWQAMVVGGASSTFALKTDGSLWAWGGNRYNRLGIEAAYDQRKPVQVGVAMDWQTIATGRTHTLALKTDGSLWAWGNTEGGALGIGGLWEPKQSSFNLMPPSVGSISINDGIEETDSLDVTLTLSCTDLLLCVNMQFSNDRSTWSPAIAYNSSSAWTLGTGDGVKTVYARFIDDASNRTEISDTITLVTSASDAGSININAGEESTDSLNVNLTLTCVNSFECTNMQFSNDNSVWSAIVAYDSSAVWTLTAGDGVKTIYVRLIDDAGNSTEMSGAINLITTSGKANPEDTSEKSGGGSLTSMSLLSLFALFLGRFLLSCRWLRLSTEESGKSMFKH